LGELILIRHGQASFGSDDYDRLSPLGHQQSDWLGQHVVDHLPAPDKVVCGTLRRHRETLSAMQKSLMFDEVTFDPRLNEIAFHSMEDEYRQSRNISQPETGEQLAAMFITVMQAWKNGQIRQAPERFETFQSRVKSAIAEVAKQDHNTLIVSSGGPIGVMMQAVLGLDTQALIDLILMTYNASYSRFRIIGGTAFLTQFNAIPHLESADRAHARTFL